MDIMLQTTQDSLYCLRQTSATFMRIFDDKKFRSYHPCPGLLKRHNPFYIPGMPSWRKNDLAHCLHHHEFCASCLKAEEQGLWRDRRTPRHCAGCKEPHGSALFLPKDIEQHDRNSRRLYCIGHIGEITLCDHKSNVPTTWWDIERHIQGSRLHNIPYFARERYKVACTDRSHEPANSQGHRQNWADGSPFPRMIISIPPPQSCALPKFKMNLGWDLPLLDIDLWKTPSLETIRETLSSLVVDALCNHRLCPHVSAGEEIRAFIQSGICKCFAYPGRSDTNNNRLYSLPDCKCKRQRTLKCRHCDAKYTWYFFRGRITLSYRRCAAWVDKPSDPAWIANLDERSYRDELFTEANRHVLWCDTPGCRTGTRRRWEELVKEGHGA